MYADIFARRERHFVLWRGVPHTPAPALVIGQLQSGAPIAFIGEQQFELQPASGFPDLWVIPADHCNLTDGQVYHYWFEVTDTHPQRSGQRIRVTDPMAYTVDWRLLAARPNGPAYGDDDRYPAAVVRYSQGRLLPCDAGGETGVLENEPPLSALPPNHHLVIYELPTAWTRPARRANARLAWGPSGMLSPSLAHRQGERTLPTLTSRSRAALILPNSGSTRSNCCHPPTASTADNGATAQQISARRISNSVSPAIMRGRRPIAICGP